MVKLLLGLIVTTGLVATTGFAAANRGADRPDLIGYTKDQCKDGGWETLGFKNQGDCVSYFATRQNG
jgi:hypothetical protein